jgi:D-alanine--poly(phosphoribitol) ligase subunit 1
MYHYNLALYFSEVANRNAKCTALRYSEQDYSYKDLLHWTERLAALLLARGCRRGDVIAIGHNKHPLSYALMLAALRLGVAYVNIDVDSPLIRASRIIEVSGTNLLFYDDRQYDNAMRELARENNCEAVFLTQDVLPTVSQSDHETQQQLMRQVDGACIAYVMFTSGSTGIPKGVAVTHQNVLHLIAWGGQYFQISVEDNFANLSPMYFDNSVFDFYVGLFSGASLSPIHRKLLSSPYELIEHVAKMRCSIWFSVPSLLIYLMAMKAITAKTLTTLRCIVFGGEGYPKTELKKLYDLFAGQALLVNVYGPTECTCICSAHKLSDDDFKVMEGLPTLGKLNQNFDYRIIDENGNDSDTGELCLIGPNVAAGYFNDLERTSLAFGTLTDPGHFMKRTYNTGDLVREVDGNLYFAGRKDNQIKHMGYRIELEEIEHSLNRIAGVEQAAVIYRRNSSSYGKIIGFVSSRASLDEQRILSELSNYLPAYMVPSKVYLSNDLPKNPNGKVDRKQLEQSIELQSDR